MHCAAQVFVLWPDDGSWYKGRVTECDVDNAKATVYYDETEETEECDLKELIGDGQIAFSEWRLRGLAARGSCLVGARVSTCFHPAFVAWLDLRVLVAWPLACQKQGSRPGSRTAAARPPH